MLDKRKAEESNPVSFWPGPKDEDRLADRIQDLQLRLDQEIATDEEDHSVGSKEEAN